MLKERKNPPVPWQMREMLQNIGGNLEAAWKEHEEFGDDAFTVPMHAFMKGALLPSELYMWMQVQFEAVMKEIMTDVTSNPDDAATLYMVASLVPVNRDADTTGRMSQYLCLSAIWLYGPSCMMKRRPIHFSKADDDGGNEVDNCDMQGRPRMNGAMGVGTGDSEKHAERQIAETLSRVSVHAPVDAIQVGQGLNYLADDDELARRGISGFPYNEDTSITLRTVGHSGSDQMFKLALSPAGFDPAQFPGFPPPFLGRFGM
jgi:hypothetical protein